MTLMSESRRRLLLAAPALGAALAPAAARSEAPLRTPAHIVIVGSGLGGIAVAARLRKQLDGARITLVDGKREHHYQPGFTLIASGVWPEHKVRNLNSDFHPEGVDWVQEAALVIDPVATDRRHRQRPAACATTSWWWPPACTWTTRRSRAWTWPPSAATGWPASTPAPRPRAAAGRPSTPSARRAARR
jgi:choline dehydrogenase-like flavoprotein